MILYCHLTAAQVTVTSSCAGLSLKQTELSGILFSTENSDYNYNSGSDYFYLDNMDCQWNLASSTKVEVTFFNFNTEPNVDYLYVYDGDSSSSSLIGKFSGTSLPAPITSSSNKLYLRFTSDGSVQARGFTAAYRGRNFFHLMPHYICNTYTLITILKQLLTLLTVLHLLTLHFNTCLMPICILPKSYITVNTVLKI